MVSKNVGTMLADGYPGSAIVFSRASVLGSLLARTKRIRTWLQLPRMAFHGRQITHPSQAHLLAVAKSSARA